MLDTSEEESTPDSSQEKDNTEAFSDAPASESKKTDSEQSTDDSPAAKRARSQALYVLDEPTVGLHMADVEKLIKVLHRLVAVGNTVVVVEHNLDIWAEADWILDLGPDGGAGGGKLVGADTPAALAKKAKTHTGRSLARFLAGP